MPVSDTPKIPATEVTVIILPVGRTRMAAGIINDSHRRLFLKYGLGASKKNVSLVIEPGQSGSILSTWREEITGFWEPLGNKPDGSFFFPGEPAGAMITDLRGRMG